MSASSFPVPYGLIGWGLIGVVLALLAAATFRVGRSGLLADLFFGIGGALAGGAPVGFLTREMVGVVGSGLTAFVGAGCAIALGRVVLSSFRRPAP